MSPEVRATTTAPDAPSLQHRQAACVATAGQHEKRTTPTGRSHLDRPARRSGWPEVAAASIPGLETTRLDTRYAAETPEGIALSLRPAGIVPRFYAYLVDLALRGALFLAAAIALGQFGGFGSGIFLVVFFLLEWLYPVVFELGGRAATPGKRAMGLAVVMDSGLPVTPAASLTRNLLRAADFLPSMNAFAVLSMLLRHDFKRLGDLAAGTLVVHAPNRAAPPVELPPAPVRAPAALPGPRAQAAIVAWAGRVSRLTAARADELAEIAVPVVAPRAMQGDRVAALLGVAHWLLGRR